MVKKDVLRFPQRAKKGSLPELNALPLVVYISGFQPRESVLAKVTQFRLARISVLKNRYARAKSERTQFTVLRMLLMETLLILHALANGAIVEKGPLVPCLEEISLRGWSKAYILKIEVEEAV